MSAGPAGRGQPLPQTAATPVVGYVVSRFPHFSETFIVREMTAIEQCGVLVVPCALVRQRQPAVHEAARAWLPRVRWTRLRDGLLAANARAWLDDPGLSARVWVEAVGGNARSLRFLLRTLVVVPKAVLLAEVLKGAGASHVHAHYATHPALAAWVVHRLTGLPYSVTVHAHDIFTVSPMLRTKLSGASFVVTVSDYNRRWLAAHVGEDVADRARTVHCGVHPDDYRAPRVARRLGEPLRVLTTGSLQEYKGQRHLVEACALLRGQGRDVALVVVGEGRLRPRLQQQVRELGLEGSVHLAGRKDEGQVAALLARSDCYVQPSVVARDGQQEGVPVALMEAMAAGVPVVATQVSGVPELIDDGVTGLLVAPADAEALAAAVARVADDPTAAARRADAARRTVRTTFDVTRSAQALAALFAPAQPRQEEIPA